MTEKSESITIMTRRAVHDWSFGAILSQHRGQPIGYEFTPRAADALHDLDGACTLLTAWIWLAQPDAVEKVAYCDERSSCVTVRPGCLPALSLSILATDEPDEFGEVEVIAKVDLAEGDEA
jgi:hypothetical protein